MTPAQVCELFGRNGFPLDEARAGALLEYEKLLLEWNGRINLVSRRETSDLFLRQIVGSVAFLFGGRLATGSTLLDVGTGGGLPGIPLAVILPDLRVTVVDSMIARVMDTSNCTTSSWTSRSINNTTCVPGSPRIRLTASSCDIRSVDLPSIALIRSPPRSPAFSPGVFSIGAIMVS